MDAETVVLSIRLPVKLIDRIEKNIENRGHYTTKPGYILYAMEKAFNVQLSARISIQKDIDEYKKEHNKDMTNDLLASVREKIIEDNKAYDGKKTQILIRVPKKLLADIDESFTSVGFYSNRIDYITTALINQLDSDDINNDRLEVLRKLQEKKKEEQTKFVDSMVNKIMDSSKSD